MKLTKDFMVQFVVMLNGTRLKRWQGLGSVLLLEALVAIPKQPPAPAFVALQNHGWYDDDDDGRTILG